MSDSSASLFSLVLPRTLLPASLAGFFFILSLLAAASVRAQDFFGRVEGGYQEYDTDNQDTRGFVETVDLAYQERISDRLGFSLFGHAVGNQNEITAFGPAARSSLLQWQPGAQATYSFPRFQLLANWNRVDTKTHSNGLEGHTLAETYLTQLSWNPDGLPSLGLGAIRTRFRDLTAGLDQDETAYRESLGYQLGPVGIDQFARYTVDDFSTSDFRRTTLDVGGDVQFSDTYFGGRATASASAGGTWTRFDERSRSSGDVAIPTRVVIFTASTLHNERPADDTGLTAVVNPGLIDGNFAAGTGLSLGPDAPSFENYILDFQRLSTVDSVEISVRDAAGHPLLTAGIVSFDVYTSVDRVKWAPLAVAATTTFSDAKSAYVASFPAAASRYVKLVNFGVNSVATEITEIQAFYQSPFGPEETRITELRSGYANASLTAQPLPGLNLSYGVFLLASRGRPAGGSGTLAPELTSTSVQQIAQGSALVTRWLTLEATYSSSRQRQSSVPDQDSESFLGGIVYSPNPNLTARFEATRTRETGPDTPVPEVIDGIHFSTFARPYSALDLSLDASTSRTRSDDGSISTDMRSIGALTRARLFPSFQLSFGGFLQHNETGGASPAPAQNLAQVYTEAQYQPSPQLLLDARLGVARSGDVSSTVQSYRVEWNPFPSGAIRIASIFNEDISQTDARRQFHRALLSAHWQLNPRASLDSTYTYFLSEGGMSPAPRRQNQRTFTLTFSLLL